jgi:hypothetical protein
MRQHEELWKEERTARQLNVTKGTIRRWRTQKKGPAYLKYGDEKGAAIRYRACDVEEWLSRRRTAAE